MNRRLQRALSAVLSQGYQIHPEALEVLRRLPDVVDPLGILMKAIRAKKDGSKGGASGIVIDLEDLGNVLPASEEVTEPTSQSPVHAEIEAEIELQEDVPTPGVAEGVGRFHGLFRSRYEKLMRIVGERPDSYRIQKISSLKASDRESTFKVAGLVMEKKLRRGFTELVIDDDTGGLTVVASDEEVRRSGAEGALDQLLVADVQLIRPGAAMAKAIYPPDIPDHAPNLSSKKIYAAFISDVHVGSRYFMLEAFQRLIFYLSGRMGDDDMVSRVKYLLVAGDLVDGVGVYPEQEEELAELDIRKQYQTLAQLLEQLPKSVHVFLLPGDHDPGRRALPQPPVVGEYAEPLYRLGNVHLVGDPVRMKLHGVRLLSYHGRSLTDVVAATPGLSFSEPCKAMQVLLRARHLAPIYGARTPIAPEPEDRLVIEEVPDIFHVGHLHTFGVDYYRGTLMVSSGTWQAQTKFMANMGIEPDPGRVVLVDLSTLDYAVRDFRSGSAWGQ